MNKVWEMIKLLSNNKWHNYIKITQKRKMTQRPLDGWGMKFWLCMTYDYNQT